MKSWLLISVRYEHFSKSFKIQINIFFVVTDFNNLHADCKMFNYNFHGVRKINDEGVKKSAATEIFMLRVHF